MLGRGRVSISTVKPADMSFRFKQRRKGQGVRGVHNYFTVLVPGEVQLILISRWSRPAYDDKKGIVWRGSFISCHKMLLISPVLPEFKGDCRENDSEQRHKMEAGTSRFSPAFSSPLDICRLQ
jgi:hypothetical protein